MDAANTFSSFPTPHRTNTTKRSRRSTETPNGGLVYAFAHSCSPRFSPSILLPSLFFSLPISKSQTINNQKRSESSPPSTQQIARSSVHSTEKLSSVAPGWLSRSPPGPNFVWTGCRDPLLDGAAQLATGGCLGLSLIGLPKW